jgi:putative membrane-bound dehydrogenase-like protein
VLARYDREASDYNYHAMRIQFSIIFTIVLFSVSVVSAAHAPSTKPADAIDAISVPEGFAIERVAAAPLVDRPIMGSFDNRGRLYVSDSAGVNLPGSELVKNPPHRIVVLEDVDGDGRFDRSRVFADKIVFPQGLLWHEGAVFVASPPCLWKFEDTDGDGVCDKRTTLISGFPLTGISDDMHGACLGPDGFIYVCCGRIAHHLVDVNGKALEAGGSQPVLVRCRPDGSGAEVVGGTHGNGVEVAWTEEGDAFVSGTFYGGAGMRDALIHFVEGGDYPILDQPMSAHQMKSTGELLPPMVHMGASAPAGLMRYRGTGLGEGFRGNLFCAFFNLHAVRRHVLERAGGTFHATTEDFVTSTSVDFHPTDVLEDPKDGSLLVVDTGGWFRIGCPTSAISKPDSKGGIYRVTWKSVVGPATKIVGVEEARRDAVWALARRGDAEAQAGVRAALADASASVRQVAAYSAGLHRDAAAEKKLEELVATDGPAVRREAANALGRIGDRAAVPVLLAAMKDSAGDRFLDHAIIYALIRLGDREATTKGLVDRDSSVKRGALIALDQMEDGRLTPGVVGAMLDPSDPALRKAAGWVLTRHPEWAAAMLGYFREALASPGELPAERREELRLQLLAFAGAPAVQELIGSTLRDAKTTRDMALLMLETIAQAAGGKLPERWRAAVAQCLKERDERIVRQAVLTVRALPERKRPMVTRVDRQVDFPEVGNGAGFAGTNLVKNFAVVWSGVVRVAGEGKRTFAVESNDGSRLFVDGKKVVENGGRHGMVEKSGEVELTAGDHALRLEFFQSTGGKGCRLFWDGGGKKELIQAEALFHLEKSNAEGAPLPGLVGEYYSFADELVEFPDPSGEDFDEALLGVARNQSWPADLRVDALSVAAPGMDGVEEPLFELLLASVEKSKPALLRAAAAEAIGRAKLGADQLKRLAELLASAGPLELPRILNAFARGGDASVGSALVAALERAPGAKGLRPGVLQEVVAHYPAEVRRSAGPLIDRLSATVVQQKARLDQLERTLSVGDTERGRAVFFGTKATCATCHTVRDEGGHVGPNLSQIGAVRGRRDLLEAIVYPSASFARTFEPYVVKMKDGAVEAGVISRETADAVYLTTGPRSEKRFERAKIKEFRRSDVSVMPQGLDAQLTGQELADLIAYLGSLK